MISECQNKEKDYILEAKDITYSYDDGKTMSLDGFSISIERGKKIAFMGANGGGKSTFFLCLNGILKPDSGSLFLDGKAYNYSKAGLREIRKKVGIVFQDPDNQLFSASVLQEISFGVLNLGMSEEDAKKECEKVMDALEINGFRDRPTYALSGGQKKQVSIADVLVMKPEIVLLDEPASALDPRHTELVNGIVDMMVENGITVLMATHNVDYAMAWADQIAVVGSGRVLAMDEPDKIFAMKELLKKANLKKPAAMELFESLVKKGILDGCLQVPRNLKILEEYIEML